MPLKQERGRQTFGALDFLLSDLAASFVSDSWLSLSTLRTTCTTVRAGSAESFLRQSLRTRFAAAPLLNMIQRRIPTKTITMMMITPVKFRWPIFCSTGIAEGVAAEVAASEGAAEVGVAVQVASVEEHMSSSGYRARKGTNMVGMKVREREEGNTGARIEK